jgi:hypothetical protein
MPDFFSLEQQDKRVIDSRHKFARKRYFDKHRWEPTDQIVTAIAIAEAIFGKLIWRWFYIVKRSKSLDLLNKYIIESTYCKDSIKEM